MPTCVSTSMGLAADIDPSQLWTVRHSSDTTEIDLGGVVLNSSDPAFLDVMGQRNVHILNGGLEFGAGFVPLTTMHPHTTYRLTSVKLAVTSDVEKDVADPDGIRILLISSTLESSFILEDCIFETALDTPAMSRLLACTASDGGQILMINCKFQGFRRVVAALDQCKVVMKACLVDLTMKGTYGGDANVNAVIRGVGPQSMIEMANCQLSISCAYICSHLTIGYVHLQDGSRAELQGVTFTGRTDLAATKDAPAISMAMSHVALSVCRDATACLQGCAFVGGLVSCAGAGVPIHCEDCHFSGYFLGGACMDVAAGISMYRCTIQNLSGDRSSANQCHSAVALHKHCEHEGSAELKECVLENVQGSGVFHAYCGHAKLIQCTVRMCGAGPAEQMMTAHRGGAVYLCGAVAMDMQWCYVEGGLNCAAVTATRGSHLTCKDSLLVGWGGGTDQHDMSCPVAYTMHEGTQLDLDRCSLRYHPKSRHPLKACVLLPMESSQLKARDCSLIGPSPGSCSIREYGVAADTHAAVSLDKCSLLQVTQPASCVGGANVSFVRCKGHQGVMLVQSAPEHNIKAFKCTNCSGCKECRRPRPLIIPEGTGGRGCSAEVAAKAGALSAALYSSRESADAGKAATGGTQSGTDANPTLVECAVCHRKPGDPGVPATLKLCGGCRMTRYCSSECQKEDWKLGHNVVCKHISHSLKSYPPSFEKP